MLPTHTSPRDAGLDLLAYGVEMEALGVGDGWSPSHNAMLEEAFMSLVDMNIETKGYFSYEEILGIDLQVWMITMTGKPSWPRLLVHHRVRLIQKFCEYLAGEGLITFNQLDSIRRGPIFD